MSVKVKVIKDVTLYSGNKTYGQGAVFDYSGDALAELIELGLVEKAETPAKTPEEEAAEAAKTAAAAEKRKKLEEKAISEGLGAADEVAKLTNKELKELLKDASE